MGSSQVFLPVLVVVFGILLWEVFRAPSSIRRYSEKLNTTYDYVIVGAGSAGAVLAARLSEDPTITVLLLEAGDTDEFNEFIPIPLTPQMVIGSDLDWRYRTTSQTNSMKFLNSNSSFWPRGRVIGGSSNLNYMAYVRGSRHDYDQWATEGCDGWSYKDVLPYFIKSEDNRVPWLQDSIYHGKEGPLTVSPGHVTGLDTYNSQAMQELGYPTVDCNGENQIGYEPMTLTTRDGVRCSTSLAYLRPASNRENLHVSPNSLVTKVNIVNKVATGVQFIREGRKHFVHARREVILSAGAINSPQILLLSGIGPKKHLQSLNIPVEADLPVGQNLQDHLLVPLMFFPNVSMSIIPEKAMNIWNILLYKTMGKGYLSTSGLEGNAFLNTDNNSLSAKANIQIHFISAFFLGTEEGIASSKLNVKLEMEKLFLKTYRKNTNVFTVGPTLLQPASTGTITLQSRDPFDPPIIEPNYLSNKDDIYTLRKGIRKSLELGSTQTFKRLGIKLEDTYLAIPDCKEYRVPSDEYIDCYIQHLAFTIGHPCCTCKMGGADDVSAVVDSKLRVRGISNLRVVDASVMRNIVSGNTNAPTIMIAEKAADLIKGVDSVVHIKEKLKTVL